jgi:hypothetical protein
MSSEILRRAEAATLSHLRAAGEPVREAFLFERVHSDVPGLQGEQFISVLLRLEVEGHVRVDTVRDDALPDPEPFAPRYWRVTE